MFISLAHINEWLSNYKYFILFPLVIIEGPIVTVISGSLVPLGIFNFFIAYGVIILGDLSGDILYYALGRYGGEKFIKKWGHYFGLNPKKTLKIESHFKKKGGRTLLLGKISHGIGGVFLAAAGLAKMPFFRFIVFNFLASLVKSLVLLLIGYFFSESIIKINSFFEFLGAFFVSAGLAALVIYFYYYRRKGDPELYE